MNMEEPVRLLDTTLRDGSFCISFQFTASDVAVIVRTLDAAGVRYIELGHGTGSFNHAAPPLLRSRIPQADSDEAYFVAARAAAPNAKLGVIVSTYAIDEIRKLAEYGFDFVRLGILAHHAITRENLHFVERAKSLGLTCSINLMQTIGVSQRELAETAETFAKHGADWLYIVDSAGGMLPDTVRDYVRAVRESCDLVVGLHGHHNSGMALANCLAAVEAGAGLVDGTIQGLGREVGNAPTEQLLLLLQRLGHERTVQASTVCQLSDLVRDLLTAKGNDPTNYLSGAAQIHSANLPGLQRVADERGLPLRSLLGGLAQGSELIVGYKLTAFSESAITAACESQKGIHPPEPTDRLLRILADEIERASGNDLQDIAAALFSRAAKHQKTSVLHIAPATDFPFDRPLPWTSASFYGFSIPRAESEIDIAGFGIRQPAILLVDPTLQLVGVTEQHTVLRIPFVRLLADAIALTVNAAAERSNNVWLVGVDKATQSLLVHRLPGDTRIEFVPAQPSRWADAIGDGDIAVLATDLPAEERRSLARNGASLLRPAFTAAIASAIAGIMHVRSELSRTISAGECVGPLTVPAETQIVVDDPYAPRSIVASPRGSDESPFERIARIRLSSLLNGHGLL